MQHFLKNEYEYHLNWVNTYATVKTMANTGVIQEPSERNIFCEKWSDEKWR
jgi:hypothetical protein